MEAKNYWYTQTRRKVCFLTITLILTWIFRLVFLELFVIWFTEFSLSWNLQQIRSHYGPIVWFLYQQTDVILFDLIECVIFCVRSLRASSSFTICLFACKVSFRNYENNTHILMHAQIPRPDRATGAHTYQHSVLDDSVMHGRLENIMRNKKKTLYMKRTRTHTRASNISKRRWC